MRCWKTATRMDANGNWPSRSYETAQERRSSLDDFDRWAGEIRRWYFPVALLVALCARSKATLL